MFRAERKNASPRAASQNMSTERTPACYKELKQVLGSRGRGQVRIENTDENLKCFLRFAKRLSDNTAKVIKGKALVSYPVHFISQILSAKREQLWIDIGQT